MKKYIQLCCRVPPKEGLLLNAVSWYNDGRKIDFWGNKVRDVCWSCLGSEFVPFSSVYEYDDGHADLIKDDFSTDSWTPVNFRRKIVCQSAGWVECHERLRSSSENVFRNQFAFRLPHRKPCYPRLYSLTSIRKYPIWSPNSVSSMPIESIHGFPKISAHTVFIMPWIRPQPFRLRSWPVQYSQ